jgi:hypothetical protein
MFSFLKESDTSFLGKEVSVTQISLSFLTPLLFSGSSLLVMI